MVVSGTLLRRLSCLPLLLWLSACGDSWVEAQIALEQQDWETALTKLEGVRTTHEFYVDARDLLPEVRFQAGKLAYDEQRWRDAIERLRKVEIKARQEEAQDLIGCSLYRLGLEAYDRGEYPEAARLAGTVRTQCSHADKARQLERQAREKLNAG